MKFILFDISYDNKTKVEDIYIEDNKKIKQVLISNRDIIALMTENPSFFKKIKIKVINNRFKKVLKNALEKYNYKWYYFLSNKFTKEQKDFLNIKFEDFLGYKYTPLDEMNKNIFKYVKDFSDEKNIKLQDIRILLVCKDSKSLNLSLVKELLNEYKSVDIYIKEKVSSYIQKQVKTINKCLGSTTDILKTDKKSFKEYDVIYFVNLSKKDFVRFRFNKNSLIIDSNIEYNDKYNSNIIFLDSYIKTITSKSIINEIINSYGKLETAITIKNVV